MGAFVSLVIMCHQNSQKQAEIPTIHRNRRDTNTPSELGK